MAAQVTPFIHPGAWCSFRDGDEICGERAMFRIVLSPRAKHSLVLLACHSHACAYTGEELPERV